MATVHFGKTWWGQQWLNSLSNIDYSNRLPRGASYARNGSVKNITIDENMINAKVQGSQRTPYKVGIIIPPFFDKEINNLIEKLSQKPIIISKLMNRELDPEVLTIAEECGLKMFPKQWSDLKMQCSCPDWAVPCKHIASVIYKLSTEIDNNPFLVFDFHKVNLIAELQKKGIIIDKKYQEIPLLDTIITQPNYFSFKPKEEIQGTLSYAEMSDLLEPIVQLLPNSPVFYTGSANFRDRFATHLKKAAKEAMRIIKGKSSIPMPSSKTSPPPFLFNHHTTCTLELNPDNEYSIKTNNPSQNLTPKEFMFALWQIPAAYENDYQTDITAWRNIFMFSLNLLAHGAVMPQIVKLHNNSYSIRWLPAIVSKDVKELTEKHLPLLCSTMLEYKTIQKEQLSAKQVKSKKQEPTTDKKILVENDIMTLCSFFINECIANFNDNDTIDTVTDLFFSNKKYNFAKPGEENIAGGIHSWLQLLYITQSDYKPEI
ncbi:MAG: SWIM zinc finger family protein, partial [Bacteroidales bacterium]